ncbi:hypothetical protein AHF37_10552, partial [Paragonimus kellicotti]
HSDPKSLCVPTPRLRSHVDTRSFVTGSAGSQHLPHDLAVVASVVKQFLRNLPEPVLTNALRPVLESLPMESPQIYHSMARLVHQKLPVTHQFLLAWMLQHITHIIDRSDENLMPLANISIVLSPCLGISHRLLAVLLRPAPPDVHIDLTELNSSLKTMDVIEPRQADSHPYHWLFPHPAFVLRPYRPPLRPGPDTQRLVTEIRRRKTLCDPEVIRAELSRQQALLDQLHKAIAADQSYPESAALDGLSSQASGGSPSQSLDYVGRRRHSLIRHWFRWLTAFASRPCRGCQRGQTVFAQFAQPVLTNALRPVLESLPMESPQIYHSMARLVHQKLPVTHQFLLAWMLQHITHIIDRSDENLMPLANISIVLSPCLGISHRLLAVLLRPAPPDVHIDLTELNSSLKTMDVIEPRQADSHPYHWLFPHPAFVLRPYRPPLRPGPDVELPETDAELDVELYKQESLLFHLHERIGRGDTNPETESLLWETQRLVTEIRRRKTLCDPEVIRAELSRQQALLDQLHKAIAADQSYPESAALDGLSSQASGGSPSQSLDYVGRRRAPHASDKFGKQIAEPMSTSVVSDELWEVQRQVTMLKRRLKQQERLMLTSTQTTTSTNTTVSGSTTTSSSHIVLSGSIPLVIPT